MKNILGVKSLPAYGMPNAGGPSIIPEKGPPKPGFGDPLDSGPPMMAAQPLPMLDPLISVVNGCLEAGGSEGYITDKAASGLYLASSENGKNGIFIADSEYSVSDCTICFTGDGFNDFCGSGAALIASGTAAVHAVDLRISTEGVIRPCTFADGESTLIVKNSLIDARGGVISGSTPAVIGNGMNQPPLGLGIGGNCRAHLSVGNSHTYFIKSKISSAGWAALSTDAAFGDLYLEADDCDISVEGPGYATFCDGGCFVVLKNSRVDAATHCAILAGRCREDIRDTTVKAGKYGAMIISVFGHHSEIARLNVEGGSIESGEDCVLVRGANAQLEFRGASLSSGTGCLIRSVANDDPMATKVPVGTAVYGVKAFFSDMEAEGDIISEDTDRDVSLRLCHSRLNGRILDAYLQMDGSSRWFSPADSRTAFIGKIDPASVDAPSGAVIAAVSADGKAPSGEYDLASGGKLVIR